MTPIPRWLRYAARTVVWSYALSAALAVPSLIIRLAAGEGLLAAVQAFKLAGALYVAVVVHLLTAHQEAT